MTMTYRVRLVRLRFCMWKLWYCGLVDGRNSHVEHAIWFEAEDIQNRTVSSSSDRTVEYYI